MLVLGRSFFSRKCFDRLPPKTWRQFLAAQAVLFRPLIRVVVRSKNLVDPWKVDREVLIDTLFLRSMVPVMVSGHDQELFEPFRIRTEIAVSPGSVKGDKN